MPDTDRRIPDAAHSPLRERDDASPTRRRSAAPDADAPVGATPPEAVA